MAGNKGHFRVASAVADVTFSNPSNNKIWRSGSSYTGTLVVPSGYGNVTWMIIQHLTSAVETSGTGLSVSYTFTFRGTDASNTYALLINATKAGKPDLWWLAPGEFTCLPATFTQGQADVVIDVSTTFNGSASNFTDYAATGRKVFVKGTTPYSSSATSKDLSTIVSPQTFVTQTGLTWSAGRVIKIASVAAPNTNYIKATVSSYNSGTGDLVVTWTAGNLFGTGVHTDWSIALRERFDMFYWNSSNPLKPVHFIFDDVHITGAEYLLKIGSSHNLIVDGGNNDAIPYGINLTKATGGIFECVYITPADTNHDSFNWVINGITVDNGGRGTQGGTGFVTQMVNNATYNDSTTRFSNITVFNISVNNTTNEGYYWGHTNPGSVPEFIKSSNVLLYRLLSNHTQNEGIQMAGIIVGELFRSSFQDSGVGGTGGQNYNTQISSENDGLSWYMNQGLTTLAMVQAKTGPKGGNLEVFANIFESTAADATNANFWHLDHNSVHSTIYAGVGYNTWIQNTGKVFQMYNDANFGSPPPPVWQFYANGNVLVSNQATHHSYNSGYDSSQTIMNNRIYTDTTTPKFTNVGAKDYRPLDLTSPMFGFTPNATALAAQTHPWFEYDFFGYKRNPANRCAGAHAGFPLMTL